MTARRLRAKTRLKEIFAGPEPASMLAALATARRIKRNRHQRRRSASVRQHYNYFRDYEAGVGRYIESDPVGLEAGPSTYTYVEANALASFDFFGLARSGRTVEVPGTNATVRIDNPHVDGQQRHAHVCQKGCDEIVVNADGTGSHGTDPSKIKNKKILGYLANKGIRVVLKCGAPAFFVYDWTTGGFTHAVNEATWPLSETWAE